MWKSVREFSGRKFSADDMSLIIETTRMYPGLSQKEIASTVCELLGWQSPGGLPKRVQCVNFLRNLEQEGLIALPAVRTEMRRERATASKNVMNGGHTEPVSPDQVPITNCGAIQLELVRPGEAMVQWRKYVSSYHYLGDANVYGCQIRYIIKSEGHDLGCLLFSASSWALSPREEWIGWSSVDRKKRLHLIVNNSRFLLLPWVKIRNLASRALSMAAKRIQGDWLNEYCYAPVLLETFVDACYQGTSYKASNWIYIGETQGRGRNDRYTERALTRKAIYVYPLQCDYVSVLKGEKPWKAAAPHV